MKKLLRIATRQSPLALWQANHVRDRLMEIHPGLEVELLEMTTRGDKILDSPLAKIGGKGLFVKELEHALLEGRADIAVHSMKDVPMEFPQGLGLVAICEREEPFDAFVSNKYRNLAEMPESARLGTSSLRRQCQISEKRPGLEIASLRGNVQTRLRKLDDGEFDAIILAAAGLKRLGLEERITKILPDSCCLPAGGQGAVGIEARCDDEVTISLVEPLIHQETTVCVSAERAMNLRLQGGCQVPIAGFAILEADEIWLRGLVGSPDGKNMIRAEGKAKSTEAQALGIRIAEALLSQGADRILQEVYQSA